MLMAFEIPYSRNCILTMRKLLLERVYSSEMKSPMKKHGALLFREHYSKTVIQKTRLPTQLQKGWAAVRVAYSSR